MKLRLFALAAVSAIAISSAAHASLVLSNGQLMPTAPTQVTFTGLPASGSGPFTQNGVTVSYLGTKSSIQGNFPAFDFDAASWRPVGATGFTVVTLPALSSVISLQLGNADTDSLFAHLIGHISVFGVGGANLAEFSVPDLGFSGFSDVADILITESTNANIIAGYVFQVTTGAGFNPTLRDWSVADNLRSDNTGLSTGGPAPEPASWALMILGFGGVGTMLRRRPLAAA
jgi:hypothetical protein